MSVMARELKMLLILSDVYENYNLTQERIPEVEPYSTALPMM